MIAVFQDDQNNEYFCLTTDFFIDRFYPRYNIDNIRQQYRTRSQNPNALLKALDMMKEEYYLQAKLKKAAAKKKEEVIAD